MSLRKKNTKKRNHKKMRRQSKKKRQAFNGGNGDDESPPKAKAELEKCSICLESLDPEQQPLFTGAKCDHEFHAACINPWCNKFNSLNDCTCPLCKRNLYDYYQTRTNNPNPKPNPNSALKSLSKLSLLGGVLALSYAILIIPIL